MENLPGMGETLKPRQVPGAGAVAARSRGSGQLLPGEQGRAAAPQGEG